MTGQGEHAETFDTGSTILVTEPNKDERIEIAVERDTVMGEQEEIELSVHYYKDGQLEALPVVPQLIFTWKQEKNIWRLIEVTAAAHVPLTEPDYLLRKQQNESYEAAAQMRMGMIATAEVDYATKNPNQGYTCTLAGLFTRDPADGTEQSSNYSDPGQGSEEWNGYRFALSACSGNPATKYRITAEPVDTDSETTIFCADESGKLKFVKEGKPSTCFSEGQPVNQPAEPHQKTEVLWYQAV